MMKPHAIRGKHFGPIRIPKLLTFDGVDGNYEIKYLAVNCSAVTKQSRHGDLEAIVVLLKVAPADREYGP
jgi:hypothetical protein